jgi:hypothetical protein
MRLRLTGLFVLCAVVSEAAVQMTLEPRAVSEAIAIGQSRIEADRTRFHAPYHVPVNKAPVDFVEVVTPFRRVVLSAEARARIGDRSFGQRLAFEVLDAAPAQIDISAEFTFHPLNTFVGVPAYEISLTDASRVRLQPRSFEVRARYGPRVEGTPLPLPVPGGQAGPVTPRGASQPLLGGTVVAQFDARPLNLNGTYDVVVAESGKELARVGVDFSKLR